jgi:hypothetical protein
MKQYSVLIRDHSGSMHHLVQPAALDYNANIQTIKEAAIISGVEVLASVIKCGVGPGVGKVVRHIVHCPISHLPPISPMEYEANGGSTPLFDSVGNAIDLLSAVPDAYDPNVSFLIMVTTDGEENSSIKWRDCLGTEIRQLQASDRWTFVFRVPRGSKAKMVRLGIPAGNILEWDQTEKGMKDATAITTSSLSAYYADIGRGVSATKSFYTSDLSNVTTADVKVSLTDISGEIKIHLVEGALVGLPIKEFCIASAGSYTRGTAFYQLVKKEKAVQDHKLICIRHKITGEVYSGVAARDLLGLPHYGNIALVPGDHGAYDIYVQSTSVNRKLPVNTGLLIWHNFRQL